MEPGELEVTRPSQHFAESSVFGGWASLSLKVTCNSNHSRIPMLSPHPQLRFQGAVSSPAAQSRGRRPGYRFSPQCQQMAILDHARSRGRQPGPEGAAQPERHRGAGPGAAHRVRAGGRAPAPPRRGGGRNRDLARTGWTALSPGDGAFCQLLGPGFGHPRRQRAPFLPHWDIARRKAYVSLSCLRQWERGPSPFSPLPLSTQLWSS